MKLFPESWGKNHSFLSLQAVSVSHSLSEKGAPSDPACQINHSPLSLLHLLSPLFSPPCKSLFLPKTLAVEF